MGKSFTKIKVESITKEFLEAERSMREKLESVKAKLYIDALNDECIPIVCAVDKFDDIIFIEKGKDIELEEVKTLIERHLRSDENDEKLSTLVAGVLTKFLAQKEGGQEEHKHVVYANRSFIRLDYHIQLQTLADESGDLLCYYGQVGLMEVAKARLPVLTYELTRATGDEQLKTAVADALDKLGDLKLSAKKDAVDFLRDR